jgi:hypothetical protein
MLPMTMAVAVEKPIGRLAGLVAGISALEPAVP